MPRVTGIMDDAHSSRLHYLPLDLRIWWPHPPLVSWVERWRARARDRRLLAGLGDHALRDLGLDRADVENGGTQSFWRVR